MMPSPTAGRPPLVTVVVLNYTKGVRWLLPCLRHVLAQRDLPGPMDVLVVRNPPDERDRAWDDWAEVREELVKDEFRRVRVIENKDNEGFAGGHNVAFREVQTEFVAIVNYDARPGPTWLSELLAAFVGEENHRLGAAAAKLLFLPRFLPVELSTPGFVPAKCDPAESDNRELGVRVHEVRIDGRDVTDDVFWGRLGYDQECAGPERFRWTRPAGTMLIPVDPVGAGSGPVGPLRLTLRLAAEAIKPVELSWRGGLASLKTDDQPPTVQPAEVDVEVPAGTRLVDQLNNAGSVVYTDGYGADRGFQAIDRGQYEQAEYVFAFCGAAVCFRTEALRAVGYFDEDFFMYYEDTDLAWRLWAQGWRVRYVPTAVVRHGHSATLGEGNPRRQFHVERNRLLMLTKNARAILAGRQVLSYLLETAWLILKAVATGQRPPLGLRLRVRVVGSYLRLLPRMLWRRRELARRAGVRRRRLEKRWLDSRPDPPDH
jgi:GT2 family glycosyltransferase